MSASVDSPLSPLSPEAFSFAFPLGPRQPSSANNAYHQPRTSPSTRSTLPRMAMEPLLEQDEEISAVNSPAVSSNPIAMEYKESTDNLSYLAERQRELERLKEQLDQYNVTADQSLMQDEPSMETEESESTTSVNDAGIRDSYMSEFPERSSQFWKDFEAKEDMLKALESELASPRKLDTDEGDMDFAAADHYQMLEAQLVKMEDGFLEAVEAVSKPLTDLLSEDDSGEQEPEQNEMTKAEPNVMDAQESDHKDSGREAKPYETLPKRWSRRRPSKSNRPGELSQWHSSRRTYYYETVPSQIPAPAASTAVSDLLAQLEHEYKDLVSTPLPPQRTNVPPPSPTVARSPESSLSDRQERSRSVSRDDEGAPSVTVKKFHLPMGSRPKALTSLVMQIDDPVVRERLKEMERIRDSNRVNGVEALVPYSTDGRASVIGNMKGDTLSRSSQSKASPLDNGDHRDDQPARDESHATAISDERPQEPSPCIAPSAEREPELAPLVAPTVPPVAPKRRESIQAFATYVAIQHPRSTFLDRTNRSHPHPPRLNIPPPPPIAPPVMDPASEMNGDPRRITRLQILDPAPHAPPVYNTTKNLTLTRRGLPYGDITNLSSFTTPYHVRPNVEAFGNNVNEITGPVLVSTSSRVKTVPLGDIIVELKGRGRMVSVDKENEADARTHDAAKPGRIIRLLNKSSSKVDVRTQKEHVTRGRSYSQPQLPSPTAAPSIKSFTTSTSGMIGAGVGSLVRKLGKMGRVLRGSDADDGASPRTPTQFDEERTIYMGIDPVIDAMRGATDFNNQSYPTPSHSAQSEIPPPTPAKSPSLNTRRHSNLYSEYAQYVTQPGYIRMEETSVEQTSLLTSRALARKRSTEMEKWRRMLIETYGREK
ncbi:hypothetical protein HDU85_000993 [Gaertneriomyces sp. JEL0708]|nr:hypothetical protein HDU85_000993 [Gaertneriomyces sp. JEL0708]